MKYFTGNYLPFRGLPDSTRSVFSKYGQEFKIFKFGRMPAKGRVDRSNAIHFFHQGYDMTGIQQNPDILVLIDELNE